jgi:hypothetical protein
VARGHGGSEGSFNNVVVTGGMVGFNDSFLVVSGDGAHDSFVVVSGGDGVFVVIAGGSSVFVVITGGGSVFVVITGGGGVFVMSGVFVVSGDGADDLFLVVSGDGANDMFVLVSGDGADDIFVMVSGGDGVFVVISGGSSVFVVLNGSVTVVTGGVDRLEGLSASFEGSLDSGFQIRMVFNVMVFNVMSRSLFDFTVAVGDFISVSALVVVLVEVLAILAGKSNEISSFFGLGVQHNSDDGFKSAARVVSVQAFDSLLEELFVNLTVLVVIEVTAVVEGGQSEEGHTQRVNISLVGVTLEFKSFLGDVSEQFRSEVTLFLSDDVGEETVEALSLVEGGVRELDVLGLFIEEDVAGSDITMSESLGLEESETVDEANGGGSEFVFRIELLLLASFGDFLFEGSGEGFNEDDDLVVSGAETALFFSVVTQNVDNVVVLKVDSVLDIVDFVVEGLLVVKDDFLLDVFLAGLLVSDDLVFTVVSVDLLSSNDFGDRSERFNLDGGSDGDGALGGGGLRRVVTHLD